MTLLGIEILAASLLHIISWTLSIQTDVSGVTKQENRFLHSFYPLPKLLPQKIQVLHDYNKLYMQINLEHRAECNMFCIFIAFIGFAHLLTYIETLSAAGTRVLSVCYHFCFSLQLSEPLISVSAELQEVSTCCSVLNVDVWPRFLR